MSRPPISYRTDSQNGHIRILTSCDHSGIEVDFCGSGFMIEDWRGLGKLME